MKASISSEILPETIHTACCEEELLSSFMDLVCEMWKKGLVPNNRVGAI